MFGQWYCKSMKNSQSVLKDDLILPPDSFRLCRSGEGAVHTFKWKRKATYSTNFEVDSCGFDQRYAPKHVFHCSISYCCTVGYLSRLVPASQISQQISPLLILHYPINPAIFMDQQILNKLNQHKLNGFIPPNIP